MSINIDMEVMLSWRKLVQGVRHQKILTLLVLVTIEEILKQLEISGFIAASETKRLKNSLISQHDKDITYLQEVFYLEISPEKNAGFGDQAVKLNSLLRTINKLKRSDNNPILSSLNWQFREMMSLVRVLRDARNAAAHDLSERPEIGWNMSVYSAYLRIIEIAFVPNNLSQEIEQIKDEIASAIIALLQLKENTYTNHKAEHVSNSNETSDLALSDDIASDIQALKNLVSDINKNISSLSQSLEQPPNHETVPLTGESIPNVKEFDEADGDDTDEIPTVNLAITQEILRQRLEALRREIHESFGKSEEWLGVASNILQKSVVALIFKLKLETIEDALHNKEFMWRYDRHKRIMDKQLQMFSKKINDELKKVIWNNDT